MADEQDRIRAQRAAAAATNAATIDTATRQARLDQLKAEREKRLEDAAKSRASADPMKDPTNRPVAPEPDNENIYYYGWIGGASSGNWKLYKQPITGPADKVESATIRSEGGETQATFNSAVGANQLRLGGSYTPGVGFTNPETAPGGVATGATGATGGVKTDGNLPAGFTAGAFPPGLESLFGSSAGYAGYKIVTNPDGSQSLQVATGPNSYQTFGAKFTVDSTGKYVPFIPKDSSATGTGTGISTGTGTGTSTGTSTGGPTGPTLAKDVFKATMALYFGQAELAKGWMDELYNVVSKFYRNGVEVATAFNMALLDARNNPNLKAFTDRFKGIYALQDLRQAGKPVEVPTIAQYVASQIGMADVLKQANLSDLATEEFTGELIGKGNSVTTIAEKIAKAYQRIDMAPKAIKDTLSRYYPTVDRPTLARTILLGQKGVDELVDELGKFEVLAAAEQQGLGAITKKGGLTEERAMEYARAGGTFQSLAPKFGQIARALPDVEKLAGISRVPDITQADVEKAVISQSEKELRRLEDISLQEEARFRAKAGRADIPLASQRRANRAF